MVSLPDELVKLEAGGVQGQVGHQAVDGVLKSEDSYNFIHGTHNWKIFEPFNTNNVTKPQQSITRYLFNAMSQMFRAQFPNGIIKSFSFLM